MVELLFLLVGAHFVADFVLQPDVVAAGKHRVRPATLATDHLPPWPYFLLGHAFTHAIAVFLITQSVWLGLAELVLHALLDHLKCENRISFTIDQSLHLACKVGYCVVLTTTL